MTHIAPLLLLTLILTSSLLGLGAAETSVLCAWSKVLSNGEVHYSFLRRGSPSVRLYHSAWSGQERALLSCAWSDDAAVIHNYFSLCLERAHEFSDEPDENFDVESMIGGEEQCVSLASPGPGGSELGGRTGKKPMRRRRRRNSVAQNSQGQDERSEVKIHKRVKRGFIVPGTLWCGSGNKAPSYADLGVFAETDSCCREHDQCKYTILSFQSEFGVFNSNIFTMSHCDCDNKFHSCLMEANDSIADVVGYTFFNLLKMHCFEFSHRLQCTERNWFGMCKETKMALYADVHPPTLYESEVSINSTSSNANATIPADPQLFSITAAASTVPTPSTSSPSASITPVTNVTTSTVTNTPEGPKVSVPENTLPTKNRTEPDADTAEMQLSCGVYKDLDECRNKILPQQRRYGLHNPEPRTLYHCNCTIRFFQTLVKQRKLTEVQALLLGYVSQSCFLPQDCTAGKTCTAVLVRADLPPLEQGSSAEVEEQHHLQAVRLTLRRQNTRRAKRKDRAVKLHRLCLRMTRPKQKNKTRKHGQNAQQPAVRGRELV
ncbi:group 3 secretory phospholipase A2-like [Seriola dumerili]|uniref:group 3 secretory phospholipase A2-like n=1 Tax=Seriola dumerili TaxID=41447 RepID=UPI000BBE386C|nr:group 3 secretory phospholipase A2-like [Seriola dumerili]